ncbi:MAG TPA: putative holin [Rhodocyclaceae bacterium]|nr:putative holin [Rhodocyclaceae bacterium]
MKNLLSPLPRLTDWIVITLVLTLTVLLIAPQQIPVSIYKLSLVSLAAVAGYWVDRSMFPYARPHQCRELMRDDLGLIFCAVMLRRALIVSAAMLAVGLGA